MDKDSGRVSSFFLTHRAGSGHFVRDQGSGGRGERVETGQENFRLRKKTVPFKAPSAVLLENTRILLFLSLGDWISLDLILLL